MAGPAFRSPFQAMAAEAAIQQAAPIMETSTYERKKATEKDHPGRSPIPEHFPVEEITIEPEEDTTGLVKIGEERTETVEYTPASLELVCVLASDEKTPLF